MQIKIQDFEIKKIDYRELIPIQGNLKDLSKKNYEKLKKSFSDKGLFVPVFVWENEGQFKLLDGHGRERFFKKENAEFIDEKGQKTFEIPCLIIQAENLKDAKEKLLIISSQYQTITQEGFDEFTFDIDSSWLKETTNFDGLFDQVDMTLSPGYTDPDEIPATPEEPETRLGDIYQLGGHVLMCGDSTDPQFVEELLHGIDEVHACITDPPYSVDYGQADQDLKNAGYGKKDDSIYKAYKEGKSEKEAGDILAFIDLVPSKVLIFSYPIDRHFFELADALKKNKFRFHKELVWIKNKSVFSPFSKTYQQKHEPILFCVKDGGIVTEESLQSIDYLQEHQPILVALKEGSKLPNKIPATQTTVLSFDKPSSHDIHPTAKPVDMWALLVNYHVPKGGVFYEPFAGSGTSIIAAEMLGSKCYAIEISPIFCDAIVKRWEEFTHRKAVRLNR